MKYEQLYQAWLKYNTPTPEILKQQAENTKTFRYQPLISIIMPVFNTPEIFLQEAIESVINQSYPHWEFCIADDASPSPHVQQILEKYQQQDSRIKVIFRTQNGHISATSNSALTLAMGEFIGLLDHDDVLTPDALYEVVSLLNQHPEADMIYSDEDKLNEKGELTGHFFKPDWCPDSFLSRMYTCHFGVYRREIIHEIGGFRTGYEGSQDYDLVLRFTEKTNHIFHIPKILYHWRIHSSSAAGGTEAKPYAYEAAKRALQDALDRRGEPGIIKDVPIYLGHYLVRYKILDYKRVSIIIPTRDLGEILNRCLESIFSLSIYPDYEVIVIDNGSTEAETQEILEKWQQKEPTRFKFYRLDIPFNFSKINNDAVRQATGDYLLFLNNDTEVIHPDWIDAMVEQAQRRSIGAVGALLRYPDKVVQHAGVVVGIGHFAAHSHRLATETDPGYYGQIISISNYSAVTAACLMCRREVFEQVGGFDEQLAVAYNDVDFCLKMVEQGYRNIYLPHVVLYHYESKSRGYDTTPDKLQRFMQEVTITRQRWQRYIDHDPCYNPNLTLSSSDYGLRQFAEVEISDVSIKFDDQLLKDCSIDEPEIQTYMGISQIRFKGWILGQQEKVTAVQILGNHGHVIKEIPANFPRPDVAIFHPDNSNSEFCGFDETVELTNLSNQTELLFKAVLNEGIYAKFGTVKLKINT